MTVGMATDDDASMSRMRVPQPALLRATTQAATTASATAMVDALPAMTMVRPSEA